MIEFHFHYPHYGGRFQIIQAPEFVEIIESTDEINSSIIHVIQIELTSSFMVVVTSKSHMLRLQKKPINSIHLVKFKKYIVIYIKSICHEIYVQTQILTICY
jgi:hypothetical protein